MKIKLKLITLSSLFLLLCASCSSNYSERTANSLKRWDSEIWERAYFQGDTLPKIILDSLSFINSKKLSKKTQAYYNLIHTIISDRADLKFTNDSVISQAVEYYKDSKSDCYNYSRSLLYEGIIIYNINPYDTSAFSPLKCAEEQYIIGHLSDSKLLSSIYTMIGATCTINQLFKKSLEYHKKALKHYEQQNDLFNIYNTQCDIISSLLALGKIEEAWEKINYLSSVDTLPKRVYYNYISNLSLYYKVIGDIEKSLYYKKCYLTIIILNGKSPFISQSCQVTTSSVLKTVHYTTYIC